MFDIFDLKKKKKEKKKQDIWNMTTLVSIFANILIFSDYFSRMHNKMYYLFIC